MEAVVVLKTENHGQYQPIEGCGIINQFPNEILEKLFSYIDAQDLLKCRLMNRRWKEVASHLCRKRFVKLKDFEGCAAKEFFETFTNTPSQEIPWSSCTLHGRPSDNFINQKFLSLFGHLVLQLQCLDCSDGEPLLEILEQVPNLQVLEISKNMRRRRRRTTIDETSISCRMRSWPTFGSVQLPRLRYFSASADDVLGPLELISANCDPSSVTLDVRQSFETPTEEEVALLVSLLAKFFKVSLTVDNLHQGSNFSAFSAGSPTITKIWLTFTEPEQHDPFHFYIILKSFLEHCDRLEELFLCCDYSKPQEIFRRARLTLPTFPTLRTLTLDHTWGRKLQMGGPYMFLVQFQPDQFPALEKLNLEHYQERNRNLVPIFTFAHFPNVTEVRLGPFMPYNFSSLFPKLRKLYTTSFELNFFQGRAVVRNISKFSTRKYGSLINILGLTDFVFIRVYGASLSG